MTEQNYMTNASGHLVPTDKVKPEDKIENDLVNEIYDEAINANKVLENLKAKAFEDVGIYLSLLSEKYGVLKGGKKGNLTLTSYDGLTRVQISVADKLEFGAQLQVAKQLIDECIHDWADGSNNNMRALIEHAFRVDKTGQINVQNILGLRRLDITDQKWKTAMDAITDSIRVSATKRYVRIHKRPSIGDKWEPVSLDIASV